MVADTIMIAKEIEMWWDASEGLAPVDEIGDDGAGVRIDMNGVETIEGSNPTTNGCKRRPIPCSKKGVKTRTSSGRVLKGIPCP